MKAIGPVVATLAPTQIRTTVVSQKRSCRTDTPSDWAASSDKLRMLSRGTSHTSGMAGTTTSGQYS